MKAQPREEGDMKRFLIYALIVLSLLPFLESDSIADIINGDFETGDFSGWDVRIDWGILAYDPPGAPAPAGSVQNVQSYSFYSQDAQSNPRTLYPAQGQQFAKLSIGSYGDAEFSSLPGQYYVTSLRQEVFLNKGDLLTGRVGFYNRDFAPQDDSWVKIFKNNIAISNPFYAISGTPSGQYGGGAVALDGQLTYVRNLELWPWNSGNNPTYTIWGDLGAQGYFEWMLSEPNWATWSWIVPESSYYTLELAAQSKGDNIFATTVLFDAIQIPEPCTIVLIASGLLGIAVHARKKN